MPHVFIPTALRKFTADRESIECAGATVADLLAQLAAEFPELGANICDDRGAPRRFVNIFVNDQDIRSLAGLATPVAAADQVSILPAIAGG